MRGVPGFVGQRLVQAREARGLTKVSLSQMVDLSSNALSSLEAGKSLPQEETVVRLEAATGFQRAFFFRPVRVQVDGPVFWRRQITDAQRSQDKTRQRLSWALEAISELDTFVELPAVGFARPSWLPMDWRIISDEHIERLAEECRRQWNLVDCPIPDMTLALENIGIPVLAMEIESPKQSGFTHWSGQLDRPVVGCNTFECSWTRQRFNLAHELGHVLMHHAIATETDLRNPSSYKKIEEQAHRFAGALLFPRDSFLRSVRYPSLEEFAAHKQEWGIGILAQAIRARQLGLCTADSLQHLLATASKKGYRRPLGEPFDSSKPLEKPRMLKRAVEAIEMGSALVFARIQASFPIPLVDQIAIFGRSLQGAGSNVFKLRPLG